MDPFEPREPIEPPEWTLFAVECEIFHIVCPVLFWSRVYGYVGDSYVTRRSAGFLLSAARDTVTPFLRRIFPPPGRDLRFFEFGVRS